MATNWECIFTAFYHHLHIGFHFLGIYIMYCEVIHNLPIIESVDNYTSIWMSNVNYVNYMYLYFSLFQMLQIRHYNTFLCTDMGNKMVHLWRIQSKLSFSLYIHQIPYVYLHLCKINFIATRDEHKILYFLVNIT